MVVHPFDPWRHRGEKLIRYGAGSFCVALQQVSFSKDYNTITFTTIHIRHIYKTHIHANGSNYRNLFAIDYYMPSTMTQTAV